MAAVRLRLRLRLRRRSSLCKRCCGTAHEFESALRVGPLRTLFLMRPE